MVELIETKFGLLGDDPRVVDVAHRPQLEGCVLVQEVVQALGTEGERPHRLGAVELLGDSRDDAALDEVHHAVGQQLGVYAEIAMAVRAERIAFGMAPIPVWRVAPFADPLGDEPGDAPVVLGQLWRRNLDQRIVRLAPPDDLGDVDLVASERAGHLPVGFEEESGSSDE